MAAIRSANRLGGAGGLPGGVGTGTGYGGYPAGVKPPKYGVAGGAGTVPGAAGAPLPGTGTGLTPGVGVGGTGITGTGIAAPGATPGGDVVVVPGGTGIGVPGGTGLPVAPSGKPAKLPTLAPEGTAVPGGAQRVPIAGVSKHGAGPGGVYPYGYGPFSGSTGIGTGVLPGAKPLKAPGVGGAGSVAGVGGVGGAGAFPGLVPGAGYGSLGTGYAQPGEAQHYLDKD
ncbi:hypothetical protein cypCar_00045071 [Cyprinus carpio]|nr:hypothetical protein cypCar_00045071 [Cyprinus carpio]